MKVGVAGFAGAAVVDFDFRVCRLVLRLMLADDEHGRAKDGENGRRGTRREASRAMSEAVQTQGAICTNEAILPAGHPVVSVCMRM
jgi:hypothetical protein